MPDSGLLRCFGGADGVCSTVLVFGWRAASALEWVKAGIRLVTTRLLGRAPPGGIGAVLGWSPCGRQGCQRMVNGQLTDSTRQRRSVIRFSTCCCAASKYLPASSNPASHPQPTDLRPAPTGFTKWWSRGLLAWSYWPYYCTKLKLLRGIKTARAHHAWRWSGCSAALPF